MSIRRTRPAAMIRHELGLAQAYRASYADRPTDDELVLLMRNDNERDIAALEAELEQALSGDLELTLDGRPVADHRVTLTYFNRLTDSLQAAFRAVYRTMSPSGSIQRGEATLSIAGTAPGSFKVALTVPTTQLELLDDPLADRAMRRIVQLLQAAVSGTEATTAAEFAAQASEPEVRAMIRVAASMATSGGTTGVRYRAVDGTETIANVRPDAARRLAESLAGRTGREILTVTGHLTMAQDQPPRVRLTTADDEYFAVVTSDELLDRVKTLLFGDVDATLVVDMRTSPTSGTPSTTTELIDLEPA